MEVTKNPKENTKKYNKKCQKLQKLNPFFYFNPFCYALLQSRVLVSIFSLRPHPSSLADSLRCRTILVNPKFPPTRSPLFGSNPNFRRVHFSLLHTEREKITRTNTNTRKLRNKQKIENTFTQTTNAPLFSVISQLSTYQWYCCANIYNNYKQIRIHNENTRKQVQINLLS